MNTNLASVPTAPTISPGILSTNHALTHYRAIKQANIVFGSHEDGMLWMKTKNQSLANKEPITLLETKEGAESVFNALAALRMACVN